MKSKVDKSNGHKLIPILTDSKKVYDVVDKEVVKKDLYNEFDKNLMPLMLADLLKNKL